MYNYNEALFKTECETKYYIIGLILADGYISKENNRIELVLKESDKNFMEMLRDIICPGKPLKYKQQQKAYRFTIDNKTIKEQIMRYVNNREKSKFLMFPYGIPDEYLLPLIRGYSDGDGSIGVKYGKRKLADGNVVRYFGLRYRIYGTRQFLAGLEANIRRLGIVTYPVNVHKKENCNLYYIEYGFKSAKNVLDAIYKDATILLPRKYQVYKFISEADSDTLSKSYGLPENHYNTHNLEGIVENEAWNSWIFGFCGAGS